jgi:exodeoxyribonuclease-3
MKLYSWNVNGIRAVINKGEFAKFIETYDPDILCLQETKASRDQIEIDLPQYHEHFFSAVKKGYSGTAIFSKTPALQYLDGFPEDIIKIPDDVLNWAIECEVTKRPFRIIKQELEFYRKH